MAAAAVMKVRRRRSLVVRGGFGSGTGGVGACWVGAEAAYPIPLLPAAAAIARAKSRQLGKRTSGCLASARANAASKGASSGRTADGGGGGLVRWWLMTATGLVSV